MSIYQFEAKKLNGETSKLEEYQGKVLLVVNTASKCGLAPQLKGLDELYQKYKDDGFEVLGFPSDQFASQELADESKIQEFCERNFGVSFTLFSKVEVNGKNAHPLFKYLKSKKGGWLGNNIKWNFTKFLIDREGKVVERYAPAKKPSKIEPKLKKLISS